MQPPADTGRPETTTNLVVDPVRTNGTGKPAATVPPPTPGGVRRPAVVVPPPILSSVPRDPRQAAPFSLRKVVPARPPTDHAIRGGDVTVPPTAASSSPPVAATASNRTAGIDAGPEPTVGSPSLSEPRSAMINGLRWTMIGRPVVELANLFGAAVLARLVGPAEFGRYAIALIVLGLANVPTQAVQYSIVQRNEVDRDHLKTGVTLTILMGLAVCAFCLAASYTVVPMLFGAETAVLVRLMIPACFINSVNTVQVATLTRRLEFRRLSIQDMTISLVGVSVSIALAVIGLNGKAMVFGVLAGSIAGYTLVCSWVLPTIPSFRLQAARDLLRSGIAAASGQASLVGFQNCDYVIVGARVSALQAGYYFRAYSLAVVYQNKVTQVMTSVGFPVLSRAASEDEVHRLRQRMVHSITVILFPLLTALAIVAPTFVVWFYGPAWRAAVVPVQLLTIGGAAMVVAQAATVAMLATGRARAMMWWGWGHFLVYGGAVFVVARLGLPAVAAAAVVVHVTFLLISYLMMTRGSVRQAFKTVADDVLPALACCVGLAAAALPVNVLASKLGIPVLPYLLMIAVAGGAGYLLSLRLFFPSQLRHLGLLAQRLIPPRTHRLLSRFALRPQPHSAA